MYPSLGREEGPGVLLHLTELPGCDCVFRAAQSSTPSEDDPGGEPGVRVGACGSPQQLRAVVRVGF